MKSLAEYREYFYSVLNTLDTYNIECFILALRMYTTYFTIGNGGSASLASHFAQDLSKQCGIDALALTDSVPFITAVANDMNYESVFIEQLKRRFQYSGDCLIAISGSGNSPNIIKTVEWANDHGIFTMGLSGYKDNTLSKIVNLSVCVNLNDMETAESVFSFICHYVVLSLKK